MFIILPPAALKLPLIAACLPGLVSAQLVFAMAFIDFLADRPLPGTRSFLMEC